MTMFAPKFITFTGVDIRTDIEQMLELSKTYRTEWGVLMGNRLNGNRYPDSKFINKLPHDKINFALHLCGRWARAALNWTNTIEEKLVLDGVDVSPFSRIQVNGYHDIETLASFQRKINVPVIAPVKFIPNVKIYRVHYLFDKSGGRGKNPGQWPVQPYNIPLMGYAGGITPENVRSVVEHLDAREYWLDMESGVRTNEWFDLSKCEKVCKEIYGVSNVED